MGSIMEVYLQCLLLLFTLFLFPSHVSLKPVQRSTYIIHTDVSQMPKAFVSLHQWYSSAVSSAGSATSYANAVSPPRLLYAYDNAVHGFSAFLSPEELQFLKKSSGFVSAYSDRDVVLDTTHTTDFLSLNPSTGLWPASDYGKDVIIGVVDSGIWPESQSFKDEGMTPVPKKWKGICEQGQEFNSSMCNLKLIGARYFNKGLIASQPGVEISMKSARDTAGHGTHTSSTAAGNYVDGVSFFGYAKGTARGVAPRARVAVYKVCWDEGCVVSDVIAGLDQAVTDGVDIISISMGFGETQFHENPIAIASFGAMEKKVLVSSSAGNEGPFSGTIHNGIPWALTVGAGTIDRSFSGSITLGNGLKMTGWTMFPASALVEKYPLFYNKTLSQCDDPQLLAQSPYSVIICEQNRQVSVLEQLNHVARSNSVGAIFISDDPVLFERGEVPWPVIVISPKQAPTVINYARTGDKPWATLKFQETILGTKPSPAVAIYSSRGPSASYPGILKPDLIAPGSLVLAAYIPNGLVAMIGGNIGLSSEYNIISGTSMACPHASGVAALLKGTNPDWSPAVIRSAMMTTANPLDNTENPIRDNGQNHSFATPLAMGSGQIDPNRALDPGLVYDITPQDYVNLLCSMNYTRQQLLTITRTRIYNCSNPSSDLNYPSFISLYNNNITSTRVQTFRRTVTNVGDGATKYEATVAAPNGSKVDILPKTLVFRSKYDKQSYTLTITYTGSKNATDVAHGWLVWVEVGGTHRVRSPIVISPLPAI